MNDSRRKELGTIVQAAEILKEKLVVLQDAETEYRDNIPENLQATERYEKAEEACENLESAVAALEEVIDFIETAVE